MAYREFLGKYYLTPADWREINDRAADIRAYYQEIQEELRRQEELKQRREQEQKNELQREKAREFLEELEELLDNEVEEDEDYFEETSYSHETPIPPSESFQPRFSVMPEPGTSSQSHGKFSVEPSSAAEISDVRYSIAPQTLSLSDAFDEENLTRFRDAYYGSGLTRNIPMDLTFSEQLFQLMRQKGMSSPEVYKAANIDKSLFSRITSNKNYSPSKETAVSIALALKLTLEEALDLLKRAGYTISHSDLRDAAIEFCFREKIYNVIEVNILLDKLNCAPLTRIRY